MPTRRWWSARSAPRKARLPLGKTACDDDVRVKNAGTIPGGAATITFRVVIDNPLPAGVSQISNQALVTAANVALIVT